MLSIDLLACDAVDMHACPAYIAQVHGFIPPWQDMTHIIYYEQEVVPEGQWQV